MESIGLSLADHRRSWGHGVPRYVNCDIFHVTRKTCTITSPVNWYFSRQVFREINGFWKEINLKTRRAQQQTTSWFADECCLVELKCTQATFLRLSESRQAFQPSLSSPMTVLVSASDGLFTALRHQQCLSPVDPQCNNLLNCTQLMWA